MMTINAIGRVTKDFVLKKSEKSGCFYVNFSLAVNEGVGEKQKTLFFECIAFGAEAERLVNAKVKKGSLLHVTGKFGTSEFNYANGEKGYSLKLTILGWSYIPSNGQKDTNGNGDTGEGKMTSEQNVEENYSGGNTEFKNLDDDDMPF